MIRKMKPEDLEQVAQIWLKSNLEAHDFIPGQYWEENFQAVKEMLPLAEVYVWEDSGEVRGFAGLNGDFIEGIFVSSACRGAGIGKALMDWLKQDRERLCLKVYEKTAGPRPFICGRDFRSRRRAWTKQPGGESMK